MLSLFIRTTALFSVLFILICHFIGFKNGVFIMTSNFVVFLLFLYLLKNTRISYQALSNLYIANCTLTVAGLSIFSSGGIFSPFMITYIMLSAMTVLLLGNTRASLIWLIVFLIIITAIGLSNQFGAELPIEYKESYKVFF